MSFHEDGTVPVNGEIFVFGSNMAGIHGAGAAKAALAFGAKHGSWAGPEGRTYAIPTKDDRIQTLQLHVIESYVRAFIRHAKARPDQSFFVTRVGCGLAGYRDEQIAPMFLGAPANCSFAEQWRALLGA